MGWFVLVAILIENFNRRLTCMCISSHAIREKVGSGECKIQWRKNSRIFLGRFWNFARVCIILCSLLCKKNKDYKKNSKIYFVNEMGWFCNDSAILENQAKKTSGLGFGLSQPVTEILDHFFVGRNLLVQTIPQTFHKIKLEQHKHSNRPNCQPPPPTQKIIIEENTSHFNLLSEY